MSRILILLLIIAFSTCKAQTNYSSSIEFTSDLEKFGNLSELKESLKGVEIIALGENTHGLGEVFKAKVDLVKFLHKELGFNLILFESGYGDAALAWEKLDSLTADEFTKLFTSNFYYHSEEIRDLIQFSKIQNKKLIIQGFDCQPQQEYLMKRMTEIIRPVDSLIAKSVMPEFRNFNNLYQYENDKDTISFRRQRDAFILFLSTYNKILDDNEKNLLKLGTTNNEINAIRKSNQIFFNTYSEIELGSMMGWPISANIRDKSLFETIKCFKEENPGLKIIIWAQNSHIENQSIPNYDVKWMGHNLKKSYGNKYYSIGTIVYRGINLNYNGTSDFEHNDKNYLAYHLNQFQKEKFILDLRNYDKDDFTKQLLLGMESNGNTAEFIAVDRFDGLLFLNHSDIPKLLKK